MEHTAQRMVIRFSLEHKGFDQLVEINWNQQNAQTAASTPAGNDVIDLFTESSAPNLTTPWRMAKIQGIIGVRPGDMDADEVWVPLLCDGGLTAAEVEECIETTRLDINETTEREQNHRRVFFFLDAQGNPIFLTNASPMKGFSMKVNQTWREDTGWKVCIYNPHTNTFTGTDNYAILSKQFGVWVE